MINNEKEYFSEINRAFASYAGACSFKCRHCYTFSEKFKRNDSISIDKIVGGLQGEEFNVIYVSGYKENFEDPDRGIDLIDALFETYNCHILFTTRNVFNEIHIKKISKLNLKMREKNKILFACVSISAYQSFRKLEPSSKIPTPDKRIEFLSNLFNCGIFTFLTLRPICPNEFIKKSEYIDIIKKAHKYFHAIISSGIYVDNTILKNLKKFPAFHSNTARLSCFDEMEVQAVNVEEELLCIEKFCKNKMIPFFRTSILALNYIYDRYQNLF